ncbi:MAG TPA: hypothetical protein VIJ96_17990 [Acidothermaceae bacterium]
MGVELSVAVGIAVVVGAYHLLRTLAGRQQSTGDAVSASGHDAPAALLAAAVRLLAADRAEWGRAMLRELEQLESSRVRWRFTLGCVAATVRVGRRRGDPGELIVLATAVGAMSSAGLVAFAFARYPGLRQGTGTWLDLTAFALVLTAYVLTSLVLVRANTSRQVVTRLVLPGGVGIAALPTLLALFLPTARWITVLAMLLVFGAASAAVGVAGARRGRSAAAGRVAALLAAVVAGFAVFLIWVTNTLLTAGRPYDPGLVRDFASSSSHDLATYAVNDNLGSAMMLLLVVPVLVSVIGYAGAALGTRRTSS